MPESNAIVAQGFKLEIANATSPVTYTEVKEIKSFTGFDGKAAEIDVTSLQSTAKEFVMGLQDFGSLNLDVNHLSSDTGQDALRTAKAAQSKLNFRATFSDTSTVTFSAYVLSNPLKGGVDAALEASFQLRITGEPTFA